MTNWRSLFRKRLFISSIAVSMTLLFLGGNWFYIRQKNKVAVKKSNEIKSICQLKVKQISDWYQDEVNDAQVISQSSLLLKSLSYALPGNTTGNPEILLNHLIDLKLEHGYTEVHIANNEGTLLFSSEPGKVNFDANVLDCIYDVIKNQKVPSSGIYTSHTQEGIFDFIAPIQWHSQPGELLIVLRLDPNGLMFPLLSFWPFDDITHKSLLLRQENDSLKVINTCNNCTSNNSYRASFPLEISKPNSLINEEKGFFESINNAGNEVFGFYSPIPETSWHLISMVNKKEMFGDFNKDMLYTLIIISLFFLFIGAVIAWIYSRSQRNILKAHLQAQAEFKTTLYSIGDAVIITDNKGYIKNLNPKAEELTGWNEAEAYNKHLNLVYKIVSEETGKSIESPVEKVLREGLVVGMCNHTLLIAKNGSSIPIAESGAPIRSNEADKPEGVVLIFRDQSEERRQQKALQESEENYYRMFADNPQPMWIYDTNSLEFVEVNEAAIYQYGYTKEEFLSMTIKDIRPVEDIIELLKDVSITSEKYNPGSIWRHKKKDGEILYVKITSHQIIVNKRACRHVLVNDITSLKLAQDALLESESRVRSVLDNMLEGCQIIGFDWQYKYLNAAAEVHNRCKNDTLLGRKYQEVWSELQNEVLYQKIKMCLEKRESSHLENEFVFKDGSNRWFDLSVQPVEEGAFILSIDITDRKQAESSLVESEQKFRNLFTNHSAVKLIIEVDSGIIVDANNAALSFYGYSREELVIMNINQINTLSEQELRNAILKVKTQERKHFEFKHRKRDGSICEVEVFSSTIVIAGKVYLHSIVHDVTEKKKAEQKVKLLIKSIEQSPVGILITAADGKVEFLNPTFSHLTGYSSEDVLGKVPDLLIENPKDPSLHKRVWAHLLSGNTWKSEYYDTRKNGGYYWGNIAISPIVDEQGGEKHYVMVYEDITDQKSMLEELVLAKEKAEESDRLKSAFLANMSHEIRTPMNGILGFMDLIQTPDLSGKERDEYIDIVRESGARLLSTINDIIDISKIEAGQQVLFNRQSDINELMVSQLWFFRHQAEEKGLYLFISDYLPVDKSNVVTDGGKLTSVLVNLIKNALKFTEVGFVKFGCVIQGSQLKFYVEDSGRGIPDNRLCSIFERFIQVDDSISRSHEGSGLGLSISKAYIEMMGGTISVESEVDKGSKFTFTIPYTPTMLSQNNTGLLSQELAVKATDTLILIAEDDETSYIYMSKLLVSIGVKSVRAVNGEEAVAMCSTNPGISIVFMDIKMPVMDGCEATKRILALRPSLPIIALTAFAMAEDREMISQCGCCDYMSKPVKKSTILNMLSKYSHKKTTA